MSGMQCRLWKQRIVRKLVIGQNDRAIWQKTRKFSKASLLETVIMLSRFGDVKLKGKLRYFGDEGKIIIQQVKINFDL